jgi:hypothetical protein
MAGRIDLALVWKGTPCREVTRSDLGCMVLFAGHLFRLDGAEEGRAEEVYTQGR